MSDAQNHVESIAALLRQESTLALATVGANGEPCIAPLFFIADEDLTLYWLSSAASLHSINLSRTCRAAATVYRHSESWKEICGLQMHGQVSVVARRDRRKALIEQYRERFQLGAVFRVAISRCVLYAFRPDYIRYLDNSKRFGYRFEYIPRRE